MSNVIVGIGMSVDGFIAGPNSSPQNALGDNGQQIHQWMYELESWRERQDRTGGEKNKDDEVVREAFDRVGAYIMGRRMFDEGEVSWPNPPPFQAPVFVLTHQRREPWVREGGTTFTFVTDGIDSALEQATEAAGKQDVRIAGGAAVVQQFLEAGLIDELQIHIAPVLLGDGIRLFDNMNPELNKLKIKRVISSPTVTHLSYHLQSED